MVHVRIVDKELSIIFTALVTEKCRSDDIDPIIPANNLSDQYVLITENQYEQFDFN